MGWSESRKCVFLHSLANHYSIVDSCSRKRRMLQVQFGLGLGTLFLCRCSVAFNLSVAARTMVPPLGLNMYCQSHKEANA